MEYETFSTSETASDKIAKTMSAVFWDYSGYSYSGLGITEYMKFQFPKERYFILKMEYSWRR